MASTTNAPDPTAAALTAPVAKRPRFTFQVPASARLYPADPTSFAIQPLTVEEEQKALKAAENPGSSLDQELLKLCLVAANGKDLDWGLGERDRLLEAVSPKVRQFLFKAFGKVHNPTPDEDKAFLDSMRAEL